MQIQEYICHLPHINADPKVLQLDSEAVLKSIEAQHGLLVERARSIYSFSHLTFQEYFTARHIEQQSEGNFAGLLLHINEKRWREVFLLTVGMLHPADHLLLAMKRHTDGLLQHDEKLQHFLVWLEEKAHSVKAFFKPAAALRAFYIAFAFACDADRARALADNLASDFDRDRALARSLFHGETIDEFDNNVVVLVSLDSNLVRSLVRALACSQVSSLEHAFRRALRYAIRASTRHPELQRELQHLKDHLPMTDNWKWWTENGQSWIEKLRAVTIQYRNVGHNWQFTEAQKALLRQYYDTSLLLTDCLNSDCYVSPEVRDHIEATLLLPIASLPAE